MSWSGAVAVILLLGSQHPLPSLRCLTPDDENAVLETLWKRPMTAESYGVVRNILAVRPHQFLESSLPEWWAYRNGDDWYAAEVLIADEAPRNETSGAFATSELIATSSRLLYDLERMLRQMRNVGKRTPHTAFLALANRIDSDGTAGVEPCWLDHDAWRLVDGVPDAPISGEPSFKSPDDCRAAITRFHQWFLSHRGELEAAAAAERPQIEQARARMDAVTLCLH